jgi:hypothetical protein
MSKKTIQLSLRNSTRSASSHVRLAGAAIYLKSSMISKKTFKFDIIVNGAILIIINNYGVPERSISFNHAFCVCARTNSSGMPS